MKRSYIIAGFAVSLLLLGWVLRGVGWHEVRLAFAQVKLEWVGLIALLSAAVIGLRAWRWTYLLKPVHPLSLGLCIRATGIGFLGNMLLPVRAGEVVRAVVAGEGGHVPVSSVFATIVMERLVDALSFLPLMILALGWFVPSLTGPALKASLQIGAGLFGLVTVVCGLVLWGLARSPERALAFLRRAFTFLPTPWVDKMVGWGEAFVGGLRGVPTGRDLPPFIALTLAIWGIFLATNLCLFKAFDMTLPPSAVITLQVLIVLGVVLPSAPGFVGTFHAAAMGGLLLYGLPRAQALSAAFALHATIFTTIVFVGLGCLLAESVVIGRRLRLKALARAEVSPGPEAN
ncbi:flippase-like domain-containing protein [Nitrospinae bacterium AH_259_B05_G02_I21]|nr:flippase-like domain-containing protein [Nitrospinae bacterium AH_259_B05_G02_I21]MDA2932370.1 flippase-like domain-containing protein [Nitrospinae bacterium AH-259-F20]